MVIGLRKIIYLLIFMYARGSVDRIDNITCQFVLFIIFKIFFYIYDYNFPFRINSNEIIFIVIRTSKSG